MSFMVNEIRKRFAESDEKRDAGLSTPEDIQRFDDIAYGDNPVWQRLDVYRPKLEKGKKLPVIVSVHGGGWVYGDKERYQFYCMSLAQRGFAVVNFTYRLAPEFKFPAALEDTNLVFQWIFQNQEEYGLDVERVFAVGDSAGGNLLALYTAFCVNPAYAEHFSFQPPKQNLLKGIALNCAAALENPKEEKLVQELVQDDASEEMLEMLGVTRWITPQFPPVFLMTCTGDFLIKDANQIAQALLKNFVPFEFHYYGDHLRKLGHVFHCNIQLEEAQQCNDDTCRFFRMLCEKTDGEYKKDEV